MRNTTNGKLVTIAGAGPSGLTAGIILAKHGFKVVIFEKRTKVGARFNDDFQGIENWSRVEDALDELERYGISPSWWHRPFFGGNMYNTSLRSIKVRSDRPIFYMVRRGFQHPLSLDMALLDQALEAGVEIVFNSQADPSAVDIFAGGPRGKAVAIARGVTFDYEHEDHATVILNDRLAPSGYVYFLASDGRATLATVVFKDFEIIDKCLKKSIEFICSTRGIANLSNAKYWGGYGSFSIPKTCDREGALWVGEAAGFQDYLFGFGIRNAIISAALGAQSIITGQSYDELWRERLLPQLKATWASRILYESFGTIAKNGLWYFLGRSTRPAYLMSCLYNLSPLHEMVYKFTVKKTPSP